LSDKVPQAITETTATSSSTKPRFPTISPSPSWIPSRSVTTKLRDEFRKTKNDIEDRQMPNRYVRDAYSGIWDGKGSLCLIVVLGLVWSFAFSGSADAVIVTLRLFTCSKSFPVKTAGDIYVMELPRM